MSGSMNLGPEWLQVTSNSKTSKVTTPTTATPTSLKLPLAAHRYGREEMLLFYSEDVPFPVEIAYLPTLTRKQIVPPLAITPLSPLEQQVLSGRVNSDSMRGRGGHSGRGRGGRGRGGMGRPDYYRNQSGGDEYRERSYHRSNSESDKNDDRHSSSIDKTSRATQDTNWRSGGPPKEVAWVGKSWSTSSPVKDGKGIGNVWGSNNSSTEQGGGGGGGKKPWQPLPEWATTTNDNKTELSSAQNQSQNEDENKDPLPPADKPPDEVDVKDDDLDIIEDVFETLPVAIGNETTPSQILPKSVRAPSSDSVEEMERRFEKAAEAILSTEDEDTPHQSPVPAPLPLLVNNTSTDMDQWLYQDPQGDTQGPFSSQEMNNWFTAGYFTMSLHVRRVCDAHMLPLGQVIRIWGRTPFIPGPITPPPLQPTEPFWQQVFQQQHQLFPELAPPKPNPPPHPQQQQQANPDPIWRGVMATTNKEPVATNTNTTTAGSAGNMVEDQWPDLGGNRQVVQQQHHKEEERKQRMREAEEAAARHHSAELQRQREEEERRKRYEAEQLRLQEEKRREEKRREEELRQLEAERLRREEERREEERRKREEERRRIEEECKRKLEEEQRLREEKLRLEEEKLQHELYQRLQLEEQQRNKVIDESPPTSKPLPPQQKISLIDIQREEAREMALQQEMLHQQQREQAQRELLEQQNSRASLPWSSVAKGPTAKTKASSFLEIQQEQQVAASGSFNNRHHHQSGSSKNNAVPSSSSGASWSRITAGNKPQPPPAWGGFNHTPQQQQPQQPLSSNSHPLTTPPSKEPQPMSFWEECAKDSMKASVKGRGREINRQNSNGKPGGGASKSVKEEEKVRQLFTATSPDEDFTLWCKKELVKYNSDVDAVTFVNLLLEVESTYEVHDYIKSFLGESDAVHSFAKQFLERRQKIRNYTTSTGQNKKHTGGGANGGESSSSATSSSSSRNSKKKKKGGGGGSGKMQKISPSSLLGFTVNAAERPNAGEIQSAKDAL